MEDAVRVDAAQVGGDQGICDPVGVPFIGAGGEENVRNQAAEVFAVILGMSVSP